MVRKVTRGRKAPCKRSPIQECSSGKRKANLGGVHAVVKTSCKPLHALTGTSPLRRRSRPARDCSGGHVPGGSHSPASADPNDLPRRALVHAEQAHARPERDELAAEGVRETERAETHGFPRRAPTRCRSNSPEISSPISTASMTAVLAAGMRAHRCSRRRSSSRSSPRSSRWPSAPPRNARRRAPPPSASSAPYRMPPRQYASGAEQAVSRTCRNQPAERNAQKRGGRTRTDTGRTSGVVVRIASRAVRRGARGRWPSRLPARAGQRPRSAARYSRLATLSKGRSRTEHSKPTSSPGSHMLRSARS